MRKRFWIAFWFSCGIFGTLGALAWIWGRDGLPIISQITFVFFLLIDILLIFVWHKELDMVKINE